MMSDPNSSTTSLNAFSPRRSNAGQLGFLETGHEFRFADACSILKLRSTFAPRSGYGKRSVGARVVDESGAEYWLKVFGLTSSDNERWKSEIEADAVTGLRKPPLIRQMTWKHDDEFWVARLTGLVTGIVESGPWADVSANGATDPWLETLKQSLEILARQSCSRVHIQTQLFERWLSRQFRRRIVLTPSDWVPSHNDLQWSNLSSPEFSLLDWEWFGRSPRGYDQGMLIAYSCHNDDLTARLEQAFGPAFDCDVGHYGKIFAAHTIRNSIRDGWLNPSMRAPIERLIKRWEAQIR